MVEVVAKLDTKIGWRPSSVKFCFECEACYAEVEVDEGLFTNRVYRVAASAIYFDLLSREEKWRMFRSYQGSNEEETKIPCKKSRGCLSEHGIKEQKKLVNQFMKGPSMKIKVLIEGGIAWIEIHDESSGK